MLNKYVEFDIMHGKYNIKRQRCVRILYGQKCQFFWQDMTTFFISITVYTEYGRQHFKQEITPTLTD